MRIESRSRAIASAPETITIERVRAPHKGGGPRKFDIGEQSQATPRPPRRNDHSRAAKLARTPLLPPFAEPAAAQRSAVSRRVARRRAASRGITRRQAPGHGVPRHRALSIAPALHLLQPPPVAL